MVSKLAPLCGRCSHDVRGTAVKHLFTRGTLPDRRLTFLGYRVATPSLFQGKIAEEVLVGSPVHQRNVGSGRIQALRLRVIVYRLDRTRRSSVGTYIDGPRNSHVPPSAGV